MTQTEEIFLLRSQVQEARDLVDRFAMIIASQEKEIERLRTEKNTIKNGGKKTETE